MSLRVDDAHAKDRNEGTFREQEGAVAREAMKLGPFGTEGLLVRLGKGDRMGKRVLPNS